MFEAPVPGKPGGIVMQVLEPGYVLHDRLLRPARVGVTKDDGTGNAETPPSGGHIDTSV
jgi:molecular chaperone GrpE